MLKHTISLTVLIFLATHGLNATAASLPESLGLEYEVSLGVAELGSLKARLTRQADHYVVTAETYAEGMASILLGGTVREICRFTEKDGVVIPRHYRIIREGKDAFDRSVSFDWNERRVVFSSGGDTVIADGYIVDNCSVTFAFIAGGASIFEERTLHIVGGKKVRRFENLDVSDEQVTTPLGEFDTVRIEQVRFDKPDRKLIIWLAPGRNNLPVKIVDQRKSRPDTIMLLKSVEGL